MGEIDMGAFWDARARENAAYFVDNQLDYARPDRAAFWSGGAQALDAFCDLLDFSIAPTDAVVEIGCGIGRMTRVLAARAEHVRALDVSREMLARARAEEPALSNVDWLHGDGRSLDGIEDASADGVFSHVVFQHLPDANITYGYIAEIGRVLRPGGWAALHVSNDPAVHRARAGIARRVQAALGRAPKGATHPAWLGSAVEIPQLRDTAAGAGMEVARIHGEGSQMCLVLLRA